MCGEFVAIEPSGLHDLVLLKFQPASRILGIKAAHKLVRERPALASGITYILNRQASLFSYLTNECMFERLPRLDESGQATPYIAVALAMPQKENFVPLLDYGDDARLDARIVNLTAGRTDLGVLVGLQFKTGTAARAEFQRHPPVDEAL